jgi:putative hemolysin
MKNCVIFIISVILLVSCTASQAEPIPVPVPTDIPQANLPNPASVYCEAHGYRSEIRTASDGSQAGYCIFPDGNECDEWMFYRGECGMVKAVDLTPMPTAIPTALPINPADYQGWWTYIHPVYGFSIMLPEDWVVDEVTRADPLMSGHLLTLHPDYDSGNETIRMTFRRIGEDVHLWPTGVGQGEFISQGTLDVAGQPAKRILLVCQSGNVTEIWYHDVAEDQPNIQRGDMEFGFIFDGPGHCEPGYNLGGKNQRVGEMIIASLKVP